MSNKARKIQRHSIEVMDKICKVVADTTDLFKYIKRITKRKGKKNDRTNTKN